MAGAALAQKGELHVLLVGVPHSSWTAFFGQNGAGGSTGGAVPTRGVRGIYTSKKEL
jgi:hypothetical protein